MSMRLILLTIGLIALVGFFAHFQWLFYSMLILLIALAVVDSLSHNSAPSHAGHAAKAEGNPILDNVAASLIADEVKKHHDGEGNKEEKTEEKSGGHH